MEKNWIDEIREFIRKAMNEGLRVRAYNTLIGEENIKHYEIRVFKENSIIGFTIETSKIRIETPKGELYTDVYLSKRDLLELDAIILSIEEYNSDMALTEFENFFKKDENKPKDINDLDNDED